MNNTLAPLSWLAVALGGALGAMGRYYVSLLMSPENFSALDSRFPLATLLVNVLGSALIGVFYVVIVQLGLLAPEWRSFIMVGLLGAFTTFSTFALEALLLWQDGSYTLALVYTLSSVFACIAAVSITIWLTTKLTNFL